MPLSNRVLKYIKDNANNNELKITHEELARVVGSSRESISRVLKELKNDNKILLKRGAIIVCT
ncbi:MULTISPECIES: helix-turn-helix domain-containing protein [unclassified Campylobacter]|uniref:helix-turn-helix domain-containing protein n=1 Tax=unclassified Campylobacter TaxID=2593542 RepID=UPI001BD9A99A|nr:MULTISPECIES: helix-turn-helix domain-containing protein [unclassified Campylobacter]MBT0881351.1 helix-turn-helix domain-containing protein [Campylobacter sp. 2018MI27]MBT0882920.1 helix-turn-helix domain-containing protein [Campylobacter sp. 2018MI13]MBT0885229.1 helix-turn-helix domain-containing protein [Campylobacter sp. 2018MI10]